MSRFVFVLVAAEDIIGRTTVLLQIDGNAWNNELDVESSDVVPLHVLIYQVTTLLLQPRSTLKKNETPIADRRPRVEHGAGRREQRRMDRI